MNALIKSAKIIEASNPYHNKTVDILIENGLISKISPFIENSKNFDVLNLENLHISSGWFDSSVSFGEPGFEERETILQGLEVAAKSGFTAVAVNPNTHPVIDNVSGVSFLNSKSKNSATRLYPIGALTNKSKSEDLADLYDMYQAGAHVFYDYKVPVTNPNLLKIALQYVSSFDGLVCSFPQESKISGLGVVNEHINSTKLGLKGNPTLAETLQIARDIFILEYTGGKLHIPTISSQKSVELIKNAKENGLDVTCSVAIHHLFFTDDELADFNSNFKVLPPLRTKTDVEALISGVKDGVIDMVTTDHLPLNIEQKNLEFDYAAYGTIGLESAYGALQSIFSTPTCVDLLTKGKKRFRVAKTTIKEGELANISLFNPAKVYTFNETHILSKCKNAVFLNHQLKGIVYGIIANNKILLKNEYLK